MAFAYRVEPTLYICDEGFKPLPGLWIIRLFAGLDERELAL